MVIKGLMILRLRIAEIRDQIKQVVPDSLEKKIKEREELASTVYMLQEHVKKYQKQVNKLKDNQDEIKQCGRRLCIRIDSVLITSKNRFFQFSSPI